MAKLTCDQEKIQAVVFYGTLRSELQTELKSLQAQAALGPQSGFNVELADLMNTLSTTLIYNDKALHRDLGWFCGALDLWLENYNSPSSPVSHHNAYPEMPPTIKAYKDSHPEFEFPFEIPPRPAGQ